MILRLIKENALDSVYPVIKDDELCKVLEEKFTSCCYGGMSTATALEVEAAFSEYTARLIELAYLRGMQDMFNFYKDMSDFPNVDKRLPAEDTET